MALKHKHMKNQFDKMKPPKHAKLGVLFFDEVKIKEGLAFNSRSWEFTGFTYICEEKDHQSKPIDNLATHPSRFLQKYIFQT